MLQHEFLMESGGEPLYAQINRELKTKRIHSAANTLTRAEAMNASKQIYDHYDLDVGGGGIGGGGGGGGGGTSKRIYHSHDTEHMADNRTDSAKLQNSVVDSTANFYKNFHNNNNSTSINTNTDQNQWV